MYEPLRFKALAPESNLECEMKLEGFCEVSALTQQGLHAMFGEAIELAVAPKKSRRGTDKNKCLIL